MPMAKVEQMKISLQAITLVVFPYRKECRWPAEDILGVKSPSSTFLSKGADYGKSWLLTTGP